MLILGLALWYLSILVVYFITSVVLALIGRPLMEKLLKIHIRNKHMPEWTAAILVLIVFWLVVAAFIALLVPVVNTEIQILSSINVQEVLTRNHDLIKSIEDYGRRLNIQEANVDYIKKQLTSYLDFSFIRDFLSSLAGKFGQIVMGAGSVTFITFFFLKDRNMPRNIINALTPDKYLTAIGNIMSETRILLSRYFTGLILQACIFSLMVWGGLSLFGIQNAILLGSLAGALNVIPYLGPIIGGTLGVLLGITANLHLDFQTELFPMILKIVAVFSAAQLLDNFLISTLIYSKSVKAHPLEIFFVVLIAGTLTGIMGMILAVPFYTFLRIVAREFFQGYKAVREITAQM